MVEEPGEARRSTRLRHKISIVASYAFRQRSVSVTRHELCWR